MEAFKLYSQAMNVKTERIKNKQVKTKTATAMPAKDYYRHKKPDYDNILE